MKKESLTFLMLAFLLDEAILVDMPSLMTNRSQAATAVPSSAGAWISVAPNEQQRFVEELRDYAQREGLQFNVSTPPSPIWHMTGIIMVTPKGNQIQIINGTAGDKFAAGVIVLDRDEQWQIYWQDLRAILSSRYRWEDVR